MLATLTKNEPNYIATFNRHYLHSIDEVWAMLTDNDKLPTWFPELKVDDLRKGGRILFDMGNGTFEEMTITDFHDQSVLEFTWADDSVRFELTSEPEGCKLFLIETITKLTDHTPRDLAGWHVCLDVIGMLLDGKQVENRKQMWEPLYEKYVQAINDLTK
ncbi:activator of Hsp90 ATPase 1 family protein [Bacillus sp. HNG]|uniref:SRPBCC family protein n=1 Tax=Bacillus sp. HNG TaxID=2293325 RepID=UPI000E2FF33A|nr:SRPBCC family protein [Bacillus sp. HNG]RFB14721.1 activator of Hsp90 ATPase 1 family protein [Bacillus sp. HNG]